MAAGDPVARKSNIDWYSERLAVIEQEFGAKWLAKKARQGVGRRGGHPIPGLWTDAKTLLASVHGTRQLAMTPELAEFFDLAGDLETGRTLPGYADAIPAKHLKSDQYEKVCYVAHIAALGVRSDYSVEFVPTSTVAGEKTPDLSMTRDLVVLQVECKRKDNYVTISPALPTWTKLENQLVGLSNRITSDYEVIVCAIGMLEGDSVQRIARVVEEVVANDDEGEFSCGVPDCVVLARRNPPRPTGVNGIWMPAWQNPGVAAASVTVGKDGKPIYGPMLRATLYVIDSHRLSQLLSSFNQARSQINRSPAGVIFIRVDTSLIAPKDQALYFRSLHEGMERQFGPNANTRVAAVVFTGGPSEVTITSNRGWHRTLHQWTVVRNPYFPGSAELIIPGELATEAGHVNSD